MLITLPWPSSRLSPNARGHFRPIANAKKAARALAQAETYNALTMGLWEVRKAFAGTFPIRVIVTIMPPDRRARDRDNMQFQCSKAYLDGIADALAVNDVRFRPEYVFAEPKFPGAVQVEIGSTVPKTAVEDAIKAAPDDAEMKRRIMLARELGHLADDEAEDWIAIAGLREA